MGLDMYLTGERYFVKERQRGEKMSELFYLGYWRKHPNLHGFIVETFANGEDECQQIHLTAADIRMIIQAIETESLPPTTGFFFGTSNGSEKQNDLSVFNEALQWLEAKEEKIWKSIHYQASW